MQNSDKNSTLNMLIRILMSSVVIAFGLFIMIIPILTTTSTSGGGAKYSISGFVLGILIILFLPSILYCIIANITKEMEYVIIPALFLMAAEYYFFHNFSTWIASDPNAAIGLVILPVYLSGILGLSYGAAWFSVKIRKHKKRPV